MKKLLFLALIVGLTTGCCGVFECKKSVDGKETSCCAGSHDQKEGAELLAETESSAEVAAI